MRCEEGIIEVFIIKTRFVNFFGAPIRLKEGMNAAHGRVIFKDGNGCYFHIPGGDPASLRDRLMCACRDFAGLYNVDVFRERFPSIIGYEDFAVMLENGDQLNS
jgi:hypothetical protein